LKRLASDVIAPLAAVQPLYACSLRQQIAKGDGRRPRFLRDVDGHDQHLVAQLPREGVNVVPGVQPVIRAAPQGGVRFAQRDEFFVVGQHLPLPQLRPVPRKRAAGVRVGQAAFEADLIAVVNARRAREGHQQQGGEVDGRRVPTGEGDGPRGVVAVEQVELGQLNFPGIQVQQPFDALRVASGVEASGRLTPQVMAELFNGLGGNVDALKRGLAATAQALAANPNNAEAMAWHGAATLSQSTGDGLSALERIGLFQRATKEMDSAVGIAPDNPRVRMARGTVLRILTPGMPRLGNVPGLIENARLDYQRMFDLQKDRLDALGTHPLGELLQGLAELNSRQGKTADAETFYVMMQTRLKGTEYAARADEWMKTKQPLPVARTACVSCHTAP